MPNPNKPKNSTPTDDVFRARKRQIIEAAFERYHHTASAPHVQRILASVADAAPKAPAAPSADAELQQALGVLDLLHADMTGPAATPVTSWAASIAAARALIQKAASRETESC